MKIQSRPYTWTALLALFAAAGSLLAFALVPSGSPAAPQSGGDPPRVFAWNDLGMHCIDPDFSLFSLLPPYNNVNAQVVVNGQLVQSGSVSLTYEAVADADGSINSTSIGKTNFWDYEDDLFGVNLPLDVGLAGNAMPGAANVPQPMPFVPAWSWFQAEGMPFTPIDNAGMKNPYPLIRITAHDASGAVLATTVTSVPNSQEITCNRCHASGASPYARPSSGWVFDANPLLDDRLNILRLHDDLQASDPAFAAALATLGFDPAGLEATARGGHAILCDACHGSNALPGTGIAGISKMTAAMHTLHSNVRDVSGTALGDLEGRASCYVCHPGTDTRCLRGAMGKAIGPDGKYAMDCQSCHGDMQAVGDPARVGWLEEPACQNCHSGSAVLNSGAIRFTSAFDDNGDLRTPASNLFATTPDTPATGFSLYRFSTGHGDLQCSVCHGPPHAIYPTSEPNDNQQNLAVQGHVGTLTDCSVCHGYLEDNQYQGAHGMHPVDARWVRDNHKNAAQLANANCRDCHGADYRGTELSRAQGNRTYSTPFGQKTFWRGFQVGCYACHSGPQNDNANPNHAPVVADRLETTPSDLPLDLVLGGSDADGNALTFRVVSQAQHGTVGWSGSTVTYRAEPGFVGQDEFTYAAWDNQTNSNLGIVTVDVTPAACAGTVEEYGFGCPGTGGFIPTLAVEGCPTPGGSITLNATNLVGGLNALLVIGAGRTIDERWDGCVLRVSPIIRLQPIEVGGVGAGAGTGSYTIPLSPSTAGLDLTFQVFVRDHGGNQPGTFSNAVEVHVH